MPVIDDNTGQTPWLSPEQAAIYLGVAIGTLRNWTSQRYVPFARRGRVVRYHRAELDKWLSRGACKGRVSIADVAPRENC
jgi:excisionase family DNA binding protein